MEFLLFIKLLKDYFKKRNRLMLNMINFDFNGFYLLEIKINFNNKY